MTKDEALRAINEVCNHFGGFTMREAFAVKEALEFLKTLEDPKERKCEHEHLCSEV